MQTPWIKGGCEYCPPAEQSLLFPLDLPSWAKLKPQLELSFFFTLLFSPAAFRFSSLVSVPNVCYWRGEGCLGGGFGQSLLDPWQCQAVLGMARQHQLCAQWRSPKEQGVLVCSEAVLKSHLLFGFQGRDTACLRSPVVWPSPWD